MSNVPNSSVNNQNFNIFGVCMATAAFGGSVDIVPGVQASGIDVLAQSLVRRQFTPRGSAQDAPNDGIDVRTLIRAGMTQTEVSQIPGTLRNELLRDVRVKTCTVTATFDQTTNTMTIVESITSAAGPFTLTLSVSQVTVTAILNSQ
jgi:hypothetical protein